MKFRLNISKGFQVIEGHDFVQDRRTDGRTEERKGKTIRLPTLPGGGKT